MASEGGVLSTAFDDISLSDVHDLHVANNNILIPMEQSKINGQAHWCLRPICRSHYLVLSLL